MLMLFHCMRLLLLFVITVCLFVCLQICLLYYDSVKAIYYIV